jgi:hypothetical protein
MVKHHQACECLNMLSWRGIKVKLTVKSLESFDDVGMQRRMAHDGTEKSVYHHPKVSEWSVISSDC